MSKLMEFDDEKMWQNSTFHIFENKKKLLTYNFFKQVQLVEFKTECYDEKCKQAPDNCMLPKSFPNLCE